MAASYQRGDGQWEFSIRRTGYPPQRRTFGTKAAGEAWARDIESRMDEGTFRDVREARELLLFQVIDRYKKEVAPNLDDPDRPRLCDVLSKEFGSYALTSLPPARITEYRDRLVKAGKAASTVNKHINALSAIYTAAEKRFHITIPGNPVKMVTRLKEPPARKQRVPSYLVRKLIEANRRSNVVRAELGGRPPTGDFKPFLLLALRTAMRRSEIARLEWRYIHWKERYAHLPKTKNGEPRDVPLSRRAIRVLRVLEARKSPGQTNVFKFGIQGFKSAWRRARNEVAKTNPEVKAVRFHDSRREATTQIAKKVSNVVELAKVTGHKKLDQLKGYYAPTPSELADKLDS